MNRKLNQIQYNTMQISIAPLVASESEALVYIQEGPEMQSSNKLVDTNALTVKQTNQE